MAVEFKESKTRENLMRAFAGESQARNRYTIAAEAAKKQGMYAVNQVFLFTADQERAHAERFYGLLKSLSGTTIHIDGGYPVDHFDDVVKLLKSAHHNEMKEFGDVYPAFAKVAKEEGFQEAAYVFQEIAKIEEIHGKRFGKLAELIENGKIYDSNEGREWMCLNCGHVMTATQAPGMCPVCKHEQGYFIRLELAPYTIM